MEGKNVIMQKLEYKTKSEDKDKKINEILKTKLKISTRLLTKLINLNKIYLNNKPADTRTPININDIITIDLNYEETSSSIIPTKMNFEIIYEICRSKRIMKGFFHIHHHHHRMKRG